jgi:RNA polymerase sigma-70 factor (ECF subfamily)
MAGTAARSGDEADLVGRLQRRDEQAFRELFRRQHAMLVALASSVLGNRGSAEEVVQETWLAVISGIGAFEGRAALSTWIASICLNKARTRAKRDGRWRSFSDLAAQEAAVPAVGPERFLADGHWAGDIAAWDPLDPERVVGGRQLWAVMAGLIDALPAAQRAAVILRDVEGQAHEDIARLLEIPDGRLRVLLHRARARLRDRLARVVAGSEELDSAGVVRGVDRAGD